MRYRFGGFELDVDAYELRRDGAVVPLQPQAFNMLRYLIEHRERVVAKGELLEALWPNEHVSESALFFCIRSVRTALGQEQVDGGPISTSRGRGYRFLAAVEETAAAPTQHHQAPPVSQASPPVSQASPPVSQPQPPVSQPQPPVSQASPPISQPQPPVSQASPPVLQPQPLAAGSPDLAPFVGRADTMQALSQALSQTIAGQGRLCILSGEAGIGKTRCSEELAALARAQGITVWTGRCMEGDGAPAFWPWIQIVRRCMKELRTEPDDADEARAILAVLTPAIDAGMTLPLERHNAGQAAERFWLLDRVARFLLKMSAAVPRVLVLDDVQWADDSSLHLLRMIAGELDSARCLLLVTVREPLPDAQGDRDRIFARLNRQATRLPLTGLKPNDVAQYVEALTSRAHADELGRALYARSAGNPLFLSEMLRLVLDRDPDAFAAASVNDLVPPLVQDVLRSRIDGLTPRTRAVLGAASVLGREFELSLVMSTAEVESRALTDALDEALRARAIVTVPGTRRHAFAHDLVRDVFYRDLGRAERLRYHERAGDALQTWSTGDDALSEIARHYYLSLPDGGRDKAVRYARAAAEAAVRVFAFADAARLYGWALEALSFGEPSPRARAELSAALGSAYISVGQVTKAREALRSAIDLADAHGLGDILAFAGRVLRQVTTEATLADPLALRALERALATLDENAGHLRARVLCRLATIQPYSEDMERSKELSLRALELAKPLGRGEVLLEALSARLYALSGPDDIDELLAMADELLRVGSSDGTSWPCAEARLFRYHAWLHRCDEGRADHELAEFGRIVSALPYPHAALNYERLRAQQMFYRGRLEEAESIYRSCYASGQRLGLDYADTVFAVQMICLQLERVGRCILPDTLSDPQGYARTPPFKAWWIVNLLAQGRREEAAAAFEAMAQSGFADIPRNLNYLDTLAKLSQAAVALGDRDRAERLYDALLPYPHHNALNLLSFCVGSTSHFLGLLAAFLGQRARAAQHFEDAIAMNERLRFVLHLAKSRLELARLLAGEPAQDALARSRALELLDQVIETSRAAGLQALLADAQALHASLTGEVQGEPRLRRRSP